MSTMSPSVAPKEVVTMEVTSTVPTIKTITLKAIPNGEDIRESFLDLDIGATGDPLESDIVYQIICGTYCFGYISPINHARAMIMSESEPSFRTCTDNLNHYKESIDQVPRNIYVCIRTKQGNISIFRIDNSYEFPDGSVELTIQYRTWKIN